MAIVYAENVVEIAVRATVGDRPHVNVWHMWGREGVGVSDEDTVRDFANNWQDHVLDRLPARYELVDFNWRSLDPQDANAGVLAPDTAKPVAGALVGPIAPPNTTFLIKKNTSNRPRGARDGRCYLSGVLEADVFDDGAIAPAAVTAWNTALSTFLAGLTDDPVGSDSERYPVVLETTAASRTKGTTPVTVASRRITSLTCDSRAATQRERMR